MDKYMSLYSIYDILISDLTVNQQRDLRDVKLELTRRCVSLYVPNSNDIKHYMVSEQNWTTMPTTGSSGAGTTHEEVTPAQEILPTTQIYMPPANLPLPKPLVMDDNLATNWNAWRKALTRYAQIEKELLAIIWSSHKFDQYIYGHDVVHIDSDHELLQAVFKKPIHQSPKREWEWEWHCRIIFWTLDTRKAV